MEQQINSTQLNLSHLIQNAKPLTATTSFFHSLNPNSNSTNPKILPPVPYPAHLAGILTTPSAATHNCLQFSDDSATVCCDVINFDARIIGKKIHVVSWNFIPLKRHRSAILEIIEWKILERDESDSFPLGSGLGSDSNGGRCDVSGELEFISAVSVFPCSNGKTDVKESGFIARVLVKVSKPVFVLLCGSASYWHSVFTKFVGSVVSLLGLKKKMVFIGKNESTLMFVTADNSVLRLVNVVNRVDQDRVSGVSRKVEFGSYTGIVSGVYMHGMVVELDKNVWLLLTDRLLSLPHSLRVGSLISVRNVHFVNPKYCWTKVLILGACYKTSIILESFSPLETGCIVSTSSSSLLGKFIDSTAFSARFWVLLLVSCLRRKFAGILSEKEILGSKNKEGLVQTYASSHLPSSVFHTRHGIFTELCKNEICCCNTDHGPENLKLVPPILNFIRHSEVLWIMLAVRLRKDSHSLLDNKCSRLLCEGKSYRQTLRKVFPSKDIGVILLGILKISPTSGRLQLVDATGCIDVLVPDIPQTWNESNLCEISEYSVVIDGIPELLENHGLFEGDIFSSRNIFQSTLPSRRLNLAIYVYFCMSNATYKNHSSKFCLSQTNDLKFESETYHHLLRVVHKFPLLKKFQGNAVIEDTSSMFAEAILLPWNLFLCQKDAPRCLTEVSRDRQNDPMEHCSSKNYKECISRKRQKTDLQLSTDLGYSNLRLSISSSIPESNGGNECCDSTSQEYPCLVTVRTIEMERNVCSGILYSSKANGKVSNPKKVLLEFKGEDSLMYKLLRIGGYYITKHDREDSFCANVTSLKINITSRMPLWSLSFSSIEEPLLDKGPSFDPPLVPHNVRSLKNFSDICLHLSKSLVELVKVKYEGLGECQSNPDLHPLKLANNSLCPTTSSSSDLFAESFASSGMFKGGNLVTVQGLVMGVHNGGPTSTAPNMSHENIGDVLEMTSLQGVTSNICIHVLLNHQSVKVFGSLCKDAYPVGFGAGVNATFYRILDYGGQGKLMLTPVSLIVVNSAAVVSDSCLDNPSNLIVSDSNMDKFSNISSLNLCDNVSKDTVSPRLICEMVHCSDHMKIQFCGRVISVHLLVLERMHGKDHDPYQRIDSENSHINVPLAAFVLDDGSGSCCCWTNAERAVSLLRLCEKLPQAAFESVNWTLKWVGRGKSARSTSMRYLEKILNKYEKLIVKNYGSILESSGQDLIVTSSSDTFLSTSDENLLKCIILGACFGSSWTIIGNLMDSDDIRLLKNKHRTEIDIIGSMPNIWASEVCYSDPLIEARNLIQELIRS